MFEFFINYNSKNKLACVLLEFPAGILQDKFFSSERPHYLNYGAIGQFVGHEITHGFDDQGRQFDVNGNLAEWWQHDTKKKFLDKAKCIIDQYSAFREPTTNLTVSTVEQSILRITT